MDTATLEARIDGMIYDVVSDLDSEHRTFLPARISSQLASLIMETVKTAGWAPESTCAECIERDRLQWESDEGLRNSYEMLGR